MSLIWSKLKPLATWTAHLVVFVGCLEVAARVDDWIAGGAPLLGRYDADSLRGVGEDGIPRNRPGAHFEKWRINSLGFRGAEIPLEKPPGRRRVVCVGQSETFGLYEAEGHEWPSQLGSLLATRHPDVDVVNVSVVGVGRDTRRAYLERYVLPLRPDVAVLTFNVFFEVTDRDAAAHPVASAPSGWSRAWIEGPRSRVVAKARIRLRSLVPEERWRAFRSWRIDRSLEKTQAGRGPLLEAAPPDRLQAFEAHLREMIALLRSRGVAPLLGTYPSLGTERDSETSVEVLEQRSYFTAYSAVGLVRAARAMNDVTRRVAGDTGVPLVDLDAAVPKSREYFADYVHYTDEGAALVASSVARALDASGVLDRRP